MFFRFATTCHSKKAGNRPPRPYPRPALRGGVHWREGAKRPPAFIQHKNRTSGLPSNSRLPCGKRAPSAEGKTADPHNRPTKGPTPRFAPSVGLGRCPGRRKATNALKRATTGDTVRGPLRWRGTALWIALGRMIDLLGHRLSEPRRTAAFFQTDVLALLRLNAISATSFVPLRLAAEFRGEEAYPYPLRLSVSPAVRSQRTPSR